MSEDAIHPVLGIDLGTTYSAVAVFNTLTDEAEIVPNALEGNERTTPSVVGYSQVGAKVIVGTVAKRNIAVNHANTVVEIKREMGEAFRPETLQKYDPKGAGGFTARSLEPGGAEGDPVKVQFINEWFLPQEISAFTLMKMKEIGENRLQRPVMDAVITVPAYFTEKQRKATEEAARLAGLYPRQLVPEPTAAAICYGLDQFEDARKIYLVYDLGGGTFDVSIIVVEDTRIDVIATSGDPRLGGSDFDDAVVDWAVEELKAKHGLDISGDPGSQAIVKFHSESLKKSLSTFQTASMPLMEIRPHDPPTLELSREQFEGLIRPLLEKSLSYVDEAILAAQEKDIQREQIDGILLVGGSSKIPLVRNMLLDHFRRDEDFVRADLDPDAVVARGAAILARRYSPSVGEFDVAKHLGDGEASGSDDDMIVHLITEHSLGIGVNEDEVSRIVNRGTNIPVSQTRGGFTNAGPTTHIDVHVYQGEGQHTYECELIGIVPLGPMEPQPAGFHTFEVTFSLDRSGLLSAVVRHVNEEKVYPARFQQKTGIGGPAALGVARERLMQLYKVEGPSDTPDVVAGPDEVTSVPPPTEAAAPVPPPTATVPPPTAPPPSPEPLPIADAPPAKPAIPEATAEVPAEYRQTYRRARRHLLETHDPALAAALEAFVKALDDGSTDEALQELGDDLADRFDEARR